MALTGFSIDRALKCTAPYLGIPREGMRPLIVRRDQFRTVRGLSVTAIRWDGEALLIQGTRKDGTRSRLRFFGPGISLPDVRRELDKWAQRELAKRRKAAISPKDTPKRVREIDAQIAKLRKRLSDMGDPREGFREAVRRILEADDSQYAYQGAVEWRLERERRRELWQAYAKDSYAGVDRLIGGRVPRVSDLRQSQRDALSRKGRQYQDGLWIVLRMQEKPWCYGRKAAKDDTRTRRLSFLADIKHRTELESQIAALEALK